VDTLIAKVREFLEQNAPEGDWAVDVCPDCRSLHVTDKSLPQWLGKYFDPISGGPTVYLGKADPLPEPRDESLRLDETGALSTDSRERLTGMLPAWQEARDLTEAARAWRAKRGQHHDPAD